MIIQPLVLIFPCHLDSLLCYLNEGGLCYLNEGAPLEVVLAALMGTAICANALCHWF